ncbi:MAG: 50S ribosomal protein L17 [Clostridiales bacterium]|jgi:large subunit ribosomal protein L17|nr:50S ribosomal protein L17 [Clostridiales bacterium]
MPSKKLGKPTDQRMAILRGQVSELFWYGKIQTTYARAKSVQSIAEKLLTKAIRTYTDTVEVKKNRIVNGKTTTVKVINDGPKKLAVRRLLLAKLYDLQEVQGEGEKRSAFHARTEDIAHPLVERIFNELAPKYADRIREKGQGGGYTRVLKLGARKGDAAEVAIIELV